MRGRSKAAVVGLGVALATGAAAVVVPSAFAAEEGGWGHERITWSASCDGERVSIDYQVDSKVTGDDGDRRPRGVGFVTLGGNGRDEGPPADLSAWSETHHDLVDDTDGVAFDRYVGHVETSVAGELQIADIFPGGGRNTTGYYFDCPRADGTSLDEAW